MLNYRHYQPGDLEQVKARYEILGPENLSSFHLDNSDMYSFTIDGRVVAVAGQTMVWPGLGEAWVHLSDEVREHPVWFVRGVKHVLEKSQRENNIRRTNALIHEDRPEYLKWCELLGFKGESYMPEAAPDGRGMFLMVKWRIS